MHKYFPVAYVGDGKEIQNFNEIVLSFFCEFEHLASQ